MNEILSFAPFAPYHLIAAGLVILLLLIAVAGIILRRVRSFRDGLALFFASGSLISLVLAVWNPVLTRETGQSARHLAVVWDVSDSTARAEGGWQAVQRTSADFLDAALAAMPADVRQQASASISTFRGSVVSQTMILEELPRVLRALDTSAFAGGSGSDIGAGLNRAAQQIASAGGSGEVLLITDGHDTIGEALSAAEGLAQRGIAVTVWPVDSREPEVAISALNLTIQTAAQSETILRGGIRNHSSNLTQAELQIFQYTSDGTEQSTQAEVPALAPNAYARLRLPLIFEGVGLQAIDVRLNADASTHARRLYTHVTRPLQLLAIGGDLRWTAAIATDVATVTAITPSELVPGIDWSLYDGLMISEVPAQSFDPQTLIKVAEAVERDSLGLLLVNGGHVGASEQDASMLRSYHETPVDPLLPVDTDPRPFEPEPPPRQVVFFIDTSGSMGGWPLDKAKEIAVYIVENLLRPEDTIDIVAFTTGSAIVVNQRQMDESGKREAISAINGLQAGGGTDPREALALIRDRRMSNCGLVFLSDGYFSSGIAEARPDCRATAFGIGRAGIPATDPLFELADPFEVDASFSPASIEIPYFEPEERDKFYESGGYTPMSMAFIDPHIKLPVPDLRLNGTAVTYLRDDAELIAIRPKFLDPVLAYRDAGQGRTGVFTTNMPPDWATSDEGRDAIQQYVLEVVGYAERERYLFEIVDDGTALTIQIMVRDPDGTPPALDLLTAVIEIGSNTYPLTIREVPGEIATYEGRVTLPRTDSLQSAQLVIEEFGPDAVARAQRVPLALPPAIAAARTDISEAGSYGTNVELLQLIAAQTGGVYAPVDGYAFFTQSIDPPVLQTYWQWLIAAGAVLFLAAIATHKL